MKLIASAASAASAAFALFAATPAFASTTTIDFEAVTGFASIANTYSSAGVGFTGGALGLVNDGTGGGLNGAFFSNAPSPVGVMFAADIDATLNAVNGARFFDAVSFFYSSIDALADAVQVFDGLDGTGNLLASFSLTANASSGCTDSAFCNWTQITRTFVGAARSITFGGTAGFAGFDNIGLNVVPEPTSVMLAALGIVGLVVSRRRA